MRNVENRWFVKTVEPAEIELKSDFGLWLFCANRFSGRWQECGSQFFL